MDAKNTPQQHDDSTPHNSDTTAIPSKVGGSQYTKEKLLTDLMSQECLSPLDQHFTDKYFLVEKKTLARWGIVLGIAAALLGWQGLAAFRQSALEAAKKQGADQANLVIETWIRDHVGEDFTKKIAKGIQDAESMSKKLHDLENGQSLAINQLLVNGKDGSITGISGNTIEISQSHGSTTGSLVMSLTTNGPQITITNGAGDRMVLYINKSLPYFSGFPSIKGIHYDAILKPMPN